MRNKVFIGLSLDGFIADAKGGVDFLDIVPNPGGDDCGYFDFMKDVDALLMGRNTFEKVLSFGIDWPYDKPVFVYSQTLDSIPTELSAKVSIVQGDLDHVLEHIHTKGYKNLYIDGGRTIQSFLERDLIDDLILTSVPVLLGGGVPLFGEHNELQQFELVKTTVYLDHLVQSHYIRKRNE